MQVVENGVVFVVRVSVTLEKAPNNAVDRPYV